MRVEFLLKTDGGYPRDAGVFFIHDGKPWEFPPRKHPLVSSTSLRERLSWIRRTRTARQDARRSGKQDAGHSLFVGGCLFGFYGEHNSKIRKGSCRDVT